MYALQFWGVQQSTVSQCDVLSLEILYFSVFQKLYFLGLLILYDR